MNDSRKFWIGVALLIALAVLGPVILMYAMLWLSAWFNPLIICAVFIGVAAWLAFRGGLGR